MIVSNIGFDVGASWGPSKSARALAALVWLLPLSCGDYVSWNERWLFDGGEGHSSMQTSSGAAASVPACDVAEVEGFGYAQAPEFWLGTQAAFELRVDGPGHLVAGTRDGSALRYLRASELSVAPDGHLEMGGEAALGYPLNVAPDGACLGQLRAPSFAPPQATSSIDITMNVDPRAEVLTFDLLDPNGTSNASVSMDVFDSAGARHYLDIYFSNLGWMAYEYHVILDGGDIVGGIPGEFVLVSTGSLQFDSNGELSATTTPPMDIPFAGGAAPGHIELRYGRDPASRASGYALSTSLESDTAVFSLSVNGQAEGTGSGLDVRPNGEIVVYYDNGTALPIGTLALARFAREAALAPFGDGRGETAESGPPQLGTPQSPGRGMLVLGAVSAWP